MMKKAQGQAGLGAHISTASCVVHLEEFAQHEGVVVGVANLACQPVFHVGQHVRQPLAAAHRYVSWHNHVQKAGSSCNCYSVTS